MPTPGGAAVNGRTVNHVVIAAGGLGTRVANWSQYLPKEFYPVDGQPGIVHLLAEIAALQPVRVVIVYHPYYESFIRWARQVLQPGNLRRYLAATGRPVTAAHTAPDMKLTFVRQRGAYADVTSVLNGAVRLPTGPLFVAYADNLYPASTPLLNLAAATPETVAVLARPFDLSESANRGVIVCATTDAHSTMQTLIEKPTTAQAVALLDEYGPDRLRLLEGRARLTSHCLAYLKATMPRHTRHEPKLSRALAHYARTHRIEVITTVGPVINLGAPQQPPVNPRRLPLSPGLL